MELMDTSLDKFYKFVYNHLHQTIPEQILGKITVGVSGEKYSLILKTVSIIVFIPWKNFMKFSAPQNPSFTARKRWIGSSLISIFIPR